MTEREQIAEEVRRQIIQEMMANFNHEKERKLANFRSQNAYIHKGQTLFTGSSLMEQFPISEFCLNEGLPIAYNRGIGGYTTDEFLAAIGPMLLDLEPSKLLSTSVPMISVICRRARIGFRICPPITEGSVKSSGKNCRKPSFT